MTERLRQQCDALLVAMVGPELVVKWWTSPNRAFANDTPELVFSTAPELVYAYLLKSAEGEW
jgi:hypothetical protein